MTNHADPRKAIPACSRLLVGTTPKSLSGCRSFSRTPRWRFLGRWNEKVGRHSESGAQSLHHRHAQPLLAPQDFADPARGTEDRHHVGTREAVLIHQVT